MSKRDEYNAYGPQGENSLGFAGSNRMVLDAAERAGLEVKGGFAVDPGTGRYIANESDAYATSLAQVFGGYGDDIDERNKAQIEARLATGDWDDEQSTKLKGFFDAITDDTKGRFNSAEAQRLATEYYKGQAARGKNKGKGDEPELDPIGKNYERLFGAAGDGVRATPARLQQASEDAQRRIASGGGLEEAPSYGSQPMPDSSLNQAGYGKGISQKAYELAQQYRNQEQSRFSVAG